MSPAVWAGPTSTSSTRLSPDRERSAGPSKVRFGGVWLIPSNSKLPKHSTRKSPTRPPFARAPRISAASASGVVASISAAAVFEATISAPATSSLPWV